MGQKECSQRKCGICDVDFCSPDCPHSEADLERHAASQRPRKTVIKQVKPHPACVIADAQVPVAGLELFKVAMDVIEAADEVGGIDCMDDYIATMTALRAEIDVRIENAHRLVGRGLG